MITSTPNTNKKKIQEKVDIDNYYDAFFKFAETFVESYCKRVEEGKEEGDENAKRRYEDEMVDQASDSSQLCDLLHLYEENGIKNVDCLIFGEQIRLNLKEHILISLRYCVMTCDGDFQLFVKRKTSLFELYTSKLKEIYHLSYDKEHTIVINVSCNHLGLDCYLQPVDENSSITVCDTLNNLSNLQFRFKTHTNQVVFSDPLQNVFIFCGLLSVYEIRFDFDITNIQYECGCENDYLKDKAEIAYTTFPPISFKKNEILQVERFYKQKEKFLQVHYAIEKYSWAKKRKSAIEKLLFIVFSLELLFGKGDSDNSIQYRLMIRTINFLSKDTKIRKDIGGKIKDIYNARSRIVHGFEKDKDRKIVDKCLKDILNYQELLRVLIIKTIGQSSTVTSHQNLLEELDYNILDINETDLSHIHWENYHKNKRQIAEDV